MELSTVASVFAAFYDFPSSYVLSNPVYKGHNKQTNKQNSSIISTFFTLAVVEKLPYPSVPHIWI